MTPAAPYHHFADKHAVLDEIGKAGFAGLLAQLDDAERTNADPTAQLAAMVEAYLRFSVAHAAHYQLMFPPGLGREAAHEELRVVAERAFARLVAAVARVRPDAAAEQQAFLALALWAMSHGFVSLARDGLLEGAPGAERFDSLVARISELAALIVRPVPPP